MRSDAPAETQEQRSEYQAPAPSTSTIEATPGSGNDTFSTPSTHSDTTTSSSPAAVQSEPSYEQQPGVDETPAEDPFGLREEERRGDLT